MNIKKTLALSLLLAATIVSKPSFASEVINVTLPNTIYERLESTNIAAGVRHEKIQRFTTSGWWQINVLRIDLTNPYTALGALYHKEGLAARDTVSRMVETHNAVAGINGDYFNYQPIPSSLGTLINDGRLLSNPIQQPWSLPTFVLGYDNSILIDYLGRTQVLRNITNNTTVNINTVNKVTTNFDTVTLLNRDWGSQSIGNTFHNDLTEVLIVDGEVLEKRKGAIPFPIPKDKNAYVLAVRNGLLDNLNPGDKVELTLQTVPNLEKIKFAIGSGSIILKDGKVTNSNINSAGNNPRTGIGVNRNNTEVLLVTIDGRDSSFKGVTQEVFGAILRDLGAYNGVNLDGGGSTTMAIRPLGSSNAFVANKPSEGSQRMVVNGVGVFSNAPVGELSYIRLMPTQNKLFPGGRTSLTLRGYDENHNPIPLSNSEIVYETTGYNGYVQSSIFYATSPGEVTITAKYGKLSSAVSITVLNTIEEINANIERFNVPVNGNRSLGTFIGKDYLGREANLNLPELSFQVLGNIGEVRDGTFYSNGNIGAGVILVRAGNGMKPILVSIGATSQMVESFEGFNKFQSTVYPSEVVASTNLSDKSYHGINSLELMYDFTNGTGTRAAYLNFTNTLNGYLLTNDPSRFGIWVKGDNSNTWLRATLVDSSGSSFVVDLSKNINFSDWQFLEASIPNNAVYPISLQRIYVAETDIAKTPKGTILFDGLTLYTPTPYNEDMAPEGTKVFDLLDYSAPIDHSSIRVTVYNEPRISGNTLFTKVISTTRLTSLHSALSNGKIGVQMGGISQGFKDRISHNAIINTNRSYGTDKNGDTLFITLQSTTEGIRAFDSNQWIKLLDNMNKINEKNIILTINRPLMGSGGFTDRLEAQLLHENFVKLAKLDKNVFVIQNAYSTKVELRDGVRYMYLDNSPIDNFEKLSNYGYIEFVIGPNGISYQLIKPYN